MLFKKLLTYITLMAVLTTCIPTVAYGEPETEATTAATETMSETTTADINTYGIDTDLTVNAEACILIDADSGIILYEKNAHEVLYPASITKIMTVLLACENGNPEDTVVHSHNAVFGIGQGSSHIGMDEGEELSFEDALYGILLESANEVCMAIAEHIDGTVEAFVDRMNQRAQELGCENTHFANPHGYHDENHYTCCYDMALITKAAVHNEEFLKVFSTVEHTIPPTNLTPVEYVLHNKDRMMRPTSPFYYENIIGGKTGFHDQALNTLVTYAGKDDIKLISVVMKDNGANLTYEDTVKLMDYGFSLYEEKSLATGDSYSGTMPVIQHYKDKVYDLGNVTVKPGEEITAVVPSFIDSSRITLKPQMEANMEAPVQVGAEVGTLELYYGEYMIGEATLVAATGMDAVPEQELERQENMERLKATALVVLKAAAIAIGVIIILTLILKLYFRLRGRHRRKKVYSYSRRYNSNRPVKPPKHKSGKRKKVKYKLKIK